MFQIYIKPFGDTPFFFQSPDDGNPSTCFWQMQIPTNLSNTMEFYLLQQVIEYFENIISRIIKPYKYLTKIEWIFTSKNNIGEFSCQLFWFIFADLSDLLESLKLFACGAFVYWPLPTWMSARHHQCMYKVIPKLILCIEVIQINKSEKTGL